MPRVPSAEITGTCHHIQLRRTVPVSSQYTVVHSNLDLMLSCYAESAVKSLGFKNMAVFAWLHPALGSETDDLLAG